MQYLTKLYAIKCQEDIFIIIKLMMMVKSVAEDILMDSAQIQQEMENHLKINYRLRNNLFLKIECIIK